MKFPKPTEETRRALAELHVDNLDVETMRGLLVEVFVRQYEKSYRSFQEDWEWEHGGREADWEWAHEERSPNPPEG